VALRDWLRRPPAPEAVRAPADELGALGRRLRETVLLTNRSAGRLPVGVVPQVRAIEDALVELLDALAARPTTAGSAQERYALEATITDYLPTSLEAYLALPPGFAADHRSPAGRTPGEELLDQLVLLEGAVRDLALAVHSGDAERLATQGRFLQTKFARSDLDLG
jgi:hypothetical protein